jgi:hypothetical protein
VRLLKNTTTNVRVRSLRRNHGAACQISFAYSGDGAITGKPTGRCNVQNRLAQLDFRVRVKFAEARVRLAVAFEVGQVQIVVAFAQQGIENRSEHARQVLAEMVVGDEIQRSARLGIIVVMPLRTVNAAALRDLIGAQAEEEKFSSPAASAISMVAPSCVPMD